MELNKIKKIIEAAAGSAAAVLRLLISFIYTKIVTAVTKEKLVKDSML